MGAADDADGFNAGRIVEEHATAAVDLRVDEPWQQQLPAEIVTLGASHAPVGRRDDVENAAVGKQHAPAFDEPVLAQDPAIDQRDAHQRVSVTL